MMMPLLMPTLMHWPREPPLEATDVPVRNLKGELAAI
jgi:hypothetical protein